MFSPSGKKEIGSGAGGGKGKLRMPGLIDPKNPHSKLREENPIRQLPT